jgi:subtilisin family serine protease
MKYNRELQVFRGLTFMALLLVILCLAFSTGPAAGAPKSASVNPENGGKARSPALGHAKGEVLVKFKRGDLTPGSRASEMADSLAAARLFTGLSRRRGQVYLHVTSSVFSTDELLDIYRSDARVQSVSPNYARGPHRSSDDPYFDRLWGLRNINAAQAWNISTGDADVVVAVIDSGVYYDHDDLFSNMWQNLGEVPGNGIDDDGNGYVDDVYGYDFAADHSGGNDSDPMDMETHGSHVAGTAAAVGNNGIGITGVAWNAKIMALKGMRPDGFLYDSDTMEAIEYAIVMKERGVNVVVINASYGGTDGDQTDPIKDIIAEAGQAGIVFVAAAGNEGVDNDLTPQYPASYDTPNIIAVAASDPFDDLATFSNFGASSVELAAPGERIFSTISGSGEYAAVSSGGTKYMAVPFEYAAYTSGLTGTVHDSGKGYPEQFPPAVSGNIALIERGSRDDNPFFFSEKVQNAMNAGAVAVIIYNDVPGLDRVTLGSAGEWTPAVFISQADGLYLASLGTPTVTVVNDLVFGYQLSDGTSMAAPHVSGAIAVLAAAFPFESVSRRINRILEGAEPLDALSGKVLTGGRLNLYNSLRRNRMVNLAPIYKLLLE